MTKWISQRCEVYEVITLPDGIRVEKETSIRASVKALELLAEINGMFRDDI